MSALQCHRRKSLGWQYSEGQTFSNPVNKSNPESKISSRQPAKHIRDEARTQVNTEQAQGEKLPEEGTAVCRVIDGRQCEACQKRESGTCKFPTQQKSLVMKEVSQEFGRWAEMLRDFTSSRPEGNTRDICKKKKWTLTKVWL